MLGSLTAIQAFGYKLPVRLSLQIPAIALLTATAFALPVVILRWSGTISRAASYQWADPAAGAVFGAALGWFVTAVLFRTMAHEVAPVPVTVAVAVMGALLAGRSLSNSLRHQAA